MSACARGCGIRGKHLAECDGTTPNGRECRGCLPRQATYGSLCWPCHRRLELMIEQAEICDRWLTGNLPAGNGGAADPNRIKHTKPDEAPTPIQLAIYDIRQQLRDHYTEWVDWLIERHHLTQTRADLAADCKRLLSWLPKVEEWPEIGELWDQTAWLQSQAHALAPWRPERRRLPGVTCPECDRTALLVYGGEDDAVCSWCGHIVRSTSYSRMAWEHEA